MFLILEHEPVEGPGIFLPQVVESGISYRRISLFSGQPIPETKDLNGVLIMGGPMNVYEESAYPFLAKEDRFIKYCMRTAVPVLGICLGAQLIAKAAGSTVYKAPHKEIGWYEVRLTEEGQRDPLLAECPSTFSVFQFHEDTFDIPTGAVHIIEAPTCPHQGFRIGTTVYGLQFHVEATAEMIAEWIADQEVNEREIRQQTAHNMNSCQQIGKNFFKNFLDHCRR